MDTAALMRARRAGEALEYIRAHADDGELASEHWVARLVAAEGDLPLLTRLASASPVSAAYLAELLVGRYGPGDAETRLRAAMAGASWPAAERMAQGWRAPLANGLYACGYRDRAMALLDDIAAEGRVLEAFWATALFRDRCVQDPDPAMLDRFVAVFHELEEYATPALLLADSGDVARLRQMTFTEGQAGWFAAVALRDLVGDEGLAELAVQGSAGAATKLVEDLWRRRDVAGLARLSEAGVREAAERLERYANEQSVHGPISGMPTEALEWVAVAIGSGVLGNAAYQGLTELVTRTWKRLRPAVPEAAPAPAPAPRLRGEAEAFLLACTAVHDYCVRSDAAIPDFGTVTYDAVHGGDDRWSFTIRERAGRRFQVRVPPLAGDDTTPNVVMVALRR
ncbi:hypothetical protein AB0M02_37635 [Actinoplanes sp. NPDC051861]|uniref:hypothetical protein n=1 Tax=Actinoplanes sp. NPDC051861 TaxID=3155170 RepID=UPI003437AB93